MSQQESQDTEEKNDAVEPKDESGIGALLKDERQKKGLSYGQMAQITKLREHALEALENEEWHNLPPSVFVRGFIRSYAKALSMEEGRLLDLYHKALPDDVSTPTQIVGPQKSAKKGIIIALTLLFGALAVSLYLWLGTPSSEPESQTQKNLPSKLVLEAEEKTEVALAPDLASAQMDIPEPSQGGDEPDDRTTEKSPLPASAVEPAPDTLFILTARVHLETYLKIYVDDQAPKEYIFKPDSRPQWEAKEGFFVMVGNAAGIEFDFNGKQYSDLGKDGQVVRLKLPEDYKREIIEE